jgi:hypothetical protein
MSIQALTTFLTVFKPNGQVVHRFQNSKVGESIQLDGYGFQYLSFIYQGAAKTRTGDNLVSALVMSVNPISMGYAYEAVNNKWNVRMDSCVMNPTTFAVSKKLTTEYWVASGMGYDTTTVEVELSSSLDAVGLVLPNRVFNRTLVGELPTTGNIQAL